MEEQNVFNVKQLSEYSGISVSYIYKLIHFEKISFSKPFGKLIFFEKKTVDEFLLSNKRFTSSEIDLKASTFVTLKKQSKGGLTK